jgi:hypothetical protein
MDWGNSSPGCFVFGAALPDGRVHIFDEHKFQRATAKTVADEVKAKCASWGLSKVPVTYCDPSLLPAKQGELGEWIGLTLQRYGIPVVRVSNDRVNGWQRVHEALSVSPEGQPWLTVHPRCKYLIRTLPLMVQSDGNPEDLDSDSDDHACDALRYLLMGGLRPKTGQRAQAAPIEPYSLAWFRQRFASREEDGVLA